MQRRVCTAATGGSTGRVPTSGTRLELWRDNAENLEPKGATLNSKLTNPPLSDESTIESAIRALTKADLTRLFRYAGWLVKFSPGAWRDFQTAEELVNEAIVRTLEGKRKWTATTPFVKHLFGVMKSCVFHSAHGARARRERFDVDVVENGTQEHTLEGSEDAVLAAEREAECAELLADVAEHFASDPDATAVLEGWRAGFSGPEIMDLNNMTKNNFESTAKRIRRYGHSCRTKRS